MQGRYKAVISNKNLYREIEIPLDCETFTVGTELENDVRLRRELFFTTVQLIFMRSSEGGWNVMCSDGLYLSAVDDVKKLLRKELKHGDEIVVRYQDSNSDVLKLYFTLDFDYERKDYNREIIITNAGQIKIGGTADCNIHITDNFVGNDFVLLHSINERLFVKNAKTHYGVNVNGVRIDKEHEIKDYDFFSIVGYSFYYRAGKLYTTMASNVTVNGLQWRALQEQSSHFKYPKFVRNTRISYMVPEDDLQIQQPIQKPKKNKRSLVMSLIPSIVMLAMTIVLRGIIGGGGTFVIYSAVSMSLGIIMSIVTYIQDNKEYKKDWGERITSYNQYIAEKEILIQQSRENELRINRLIYESLGEGIMESELFGRRLFERTIEDPDFLKVYMGIGRVESQNQVKYDKQEFIDLEDPLALLAEQTAEKYRYIEDMPIVSDFRFSGGVGVVGNWDALYQAIRNITLDLTIRHFYADVHFVYILRPEDIQILSWVRWLKNVENERLDVRNIVCDDESKNLILESLYITLSAREAQAGGGEEYIADEYYVVFVTDPSAISTHPIAKYAKDYAKYGFTFVYFQEYEELIPQGCAEMIRLDSTNHGGLLKSQNGDNVAAFSYPEISDAIARQTALKLAGVYVDEITLEGEMTKNITMFELLGILSVDDLNLGKRWENSQVHKSISVPLGVKNKNEVVSLDISDKAGAHGPHGLVAGTTGSGKSEILQTYILSIATFFHPYEVGFVIIDFKGGGMANQFEKLPHLIGRITNIDGREINRSLLSIKAELVKRQEMFSESGVNHINDYIKLYKEGMVSVPMPHLIMIVDEFAELKAEHPDFMKELISAARIGRTLGIHLILATQKPAGVVDAQIWSNSKFKLCLKVQTKEDSNEVLKTPLAAEIVEPGRAYFQVGNNEIFELFQSAYSGAPVPSGSNANEKIYAIYERNTWGKKTLKYTNKKKETNQNISQLQAIVDYVSDYCKFSNIAQLPGICLPSLPDIIRTSMLQYESEQTLGITVPVGLYDNPEQQYQGEIIFEPSRENIYIVGSAQTGKTVMLQTIAYGLIKKYTPNQVNLYMVDCGSMVLKLFENSFHVGGVVLSNEEEKCKNLFKLLGTMILQRKKILSEKGIGSYLSYLEAGYTDIPLAVVMIDNMAAFKEYFPQQAEEINGLAREAQGVGISFILTAATSNALNYKVQANFGKKVVLNCNDSGEYSNVFGHCKETPKEIPGRGLFVLDKKILEYQTAIFGKSMKESDRSEELKKFINERNSQCTEKAVQIPMIPEHLILEESMSVHRELFRQRREIVIGMDFESVKYKTINMNLWGCLALIGNTQSRIRFVQNMMQALAQNIVFHEVEAVIIDDRAKLLSTLKEFAFVQAYTNDGEEAMMIISSFCDGVTKRLQDEDITGRSKKMLIINNTDVMKKLNADKTIAKELSEAIKMANEADCFLLLANVENQNVGFNSSEVLKTVKELRQAVLFEQLVDNKIFEMSSRVKADTNFDTTMGYLFEGNTYSKIKIFE